MYWHRKVAKNFAIKKSVEFSISQVYLTLEPFIIEWFQGINLRSNGLKCSPGVPRPRKRRKKKREGENMRKRERGAHRQRQNEHKNTSRGRNRMSLVVFIRP